MKILRLCFLGGWQAWRSHRELNLKGLKTRALLAYLAVESQQAHSRDSLLGLLWPDMLQDRARNNLRVTLANLRRGLACGEDDGPGRLLADRYGVQFGGAEGFWLDVAAFQGHLSSVRTHSHVALQECQPCRQAMSQAADLYQGEFLAGFHIPGCPAFDEWLLVQRERLHIQVIELLDRLTQLHTNAQELKAAEGYARRQIELDPLQESAHRQLMHLLASQGKRPAALAAYRSCHTVLLQELGVEPDAETVMLAQQIRAGSYPAQTPAEPSNRVPWAKAARREIALNLPANLTPFIGREEELALIGQRLVAGDYRLISIVGPGGMGKTRLAVEAARQNRHRFAHGVYFVSLASRQGADALAVAIADAIGLTFAEGEVTPRRQLLEALGNRHLLLVLDNLESLLSPGHPGDTAVMDDVASLLFQILGQAPTVTLLVTSRERLNVRFEDLFLLQGLPVPAEDALAHAGTYAAVRLFCERAYRRHKGFRLTDENVAHVVHICRLMDGTPLGIELATSWIRELGPARLAEALAADLTLLATTERDVLPQHRSMEAVFAHSWRLLSETEQRVLRQLTVFRGDFSREAAHQVAGATTILLTQLRFKSLLRSTGADRYDIHPLVAQFAARKLAEAHEEEEALDRHSRHYLALLARWAPALVGMEAQQAVASLSQELDNIEKGWRTAFRQENLALIRANLAAFAHFYRLQGLFEEGEQFLAAGMQQAKALAARGGRDASVWEGLHLRLLVERTAMLIRLARLDEAVENGRRIVARAQRLGESYAEIRGHILAGYALAQQGEVPAARRFLETAVILARRADHLALKGSAQRYLGNVLIDAGEREEGERHLEQALGIQRRTGNRGEEQAVLLYLGVYKIELGDYAAGQAYLTQALQLLQTTGNRPLEARIVNALGFVSAAMGDFAAALTHHARSQTISQEVGDPFQESHALHNLCTVSRKMGRLSQAEAQGRRALEIAQEHGLRDPESYAWLHLGYVWLEQGVLALAAQAFHRSREGWRALQRVTLVMEATAGLAAVYLEQGDLERAHEEVTSVLAALEEHGPVGVDEPLAIYLACFRVLRACGDSRCREVIEQAYRQLQAKAAHIPDAARHTRFLEATPVHRQVMAHHAHQTEQVARQE